MFFLCLKVLIFYILLRGNKFVLSSKVYRNPYKLQKPLNAVKTCRILTAWVRFSYPPPAILLIMPLKMKPWKGRTAYQ